MLTLRAQRKNAPRHPKTPFWGRSYVELKIIKVQKIELQCTTTQTAGPVAKCTGIGGRAKAGTSDVLGGCALRGVRVLLTFWFLRSRPRLFYTITTPELTIITPELSCDSIRTYVGDLIFSSSSGFYYSAGKVGLSFACIFIFSGG